MRDTIELRARKMIT